MTNDDYVPARGSDLSDDDGRALMKTLWGLYRATERDPETGKKMRADTYAARASVAKLQAALLEASAHFERYYDFDGWLGRNNGESFIHYHPSYCLSDLSHEFRAMRNDVDELSKSYSGLLPLLLQMLARLPGKPPEEGSALLKMSAEADEATAA
jgi:hypothetical protein